MPSRKNTGQFTSRRRRLIITSAFAAGSLLAAYAAALRELPAFASSIVVPATTPGCTPGSTEVQDDAGLQAAVATAVQGSVVCVTSSITLSSPLLIDDTTLTIEGSSSAIEVRGDATDRLIYAHFTDAAADDTLTIRDITLRYGGATASPGAGVRVVSDDTISNDALVVDGAVISDHVAGANGGAFYVKNLDSISVVDTLFSDNSAGDAAGAIEIRHVDRVLIDNSVFDTNESTRFANDGGGAVFMHDPVDVTISNSLFTDNRSAREGAAFAVNSADGQDDSLVITGTTVSSNVADVTSGTACGAVFVYSDGLIEITDSHFTNNEAYNGGGLYTKPFHASPTGQTLTILDSTFTGNKATQRGGGLTSFSPIQLDIGRTAVSDNTLTGDGGVPIYSGGGALLSDVGTANIFESTISGNSAGTTGYGGGLSLSTYAGSSIRDTTISANSAGYDGGAFIRENANYGGTASLTNLTVSGNTAAVSGGGLGLYGHPLHLDFLTVSGNSAPRGGGIDVDDSTTVDLANSIVAGNTGGDVAVADDTTTFTSSYSLFTSQTSVTGATVTGGSNLFGSPRLNSLADNGGPTLTMLPQENSPAIEAGDPNWSGTPVDDQRGTGYPRRVGAQVNMGAVEGFSSQPPSPPRPSPAGPPRDVEAISGDASAIVSWQPPRSAGSFPVTNYRVVSTPQGGMCLVSGTSCDIEGLTNGVAYTFTVQGLTGAGWGAKSQPSGPVTPTAASILISGTRGEVRGRPGVLVTGTSTGLDVGAIVRPWVRFPGSQPYAEGAAEVEVDSDGGFTWQRRTGRTIYISFRTEDGLMKSNRLVIPAR